MWLLRSRAANEAHLFRWYVDGALSSSGGSLLNHSSTKGGHDGGYATFLRSLRTDGLLDKLVLLRSDTPFARDIAALGLEELDSRDLFTSNDFSSPAPRVDPVPSKSTVSPDIWKSYARNGPTSYPFPPVAPSQPIDLIKVSFPILQFELRYLISLTFR